MWIFVSYSSLDRSLIEALATDLTDLGHIVWFDKRLTGGHEWWKDILENIQKCDLFIFAVSNQSLDSYPCKLEYTYAESLKKRILPVLVSSINTKLLPPPLAIIQFVDYRQQDKKAIIALNQAFSALPTSLPIPVPLPPEPELPISPLGRIRERIDAPALSLQDQLVVIVELKTLLAQDEDVSIITNLLLRLRGRSDLTVQVDREIGSILMSCEQSEFNRRNTAEQPVSPSNSHSLSQKSDTTHNPIDTQTTTPRFMQQSYAFPPPSDAKEDQANIQTFTPSTTQQVFSISLPANPRQYTEALQQAIWQNKGYILGILFLPATRHATWKGILRYFIVAQIIAGIYALSVAPGDFYHNVSILFTTILVGALIIVGILNRFIGYMTNYD